MIFLGLKLAARAVLSADAGLLVLSSSSVPPTSRAQGTGAHSKRFIHLFI